MNILYILQDHLGCHYLFYAAHPNLDTPDFDKIAGKGIELQKISIMKLTTLFITINDSLIELVIVNCDKFFGANRKAIKLYLDLFLNYNAV